VFGVKKLVLSEQLWETAFGLDVAIWNFSGQMDLL